MSMPAPRIIPNKGVLSVQNYAKGEFVCIVITHSLDETPIPLTTVIGKHLQHSDAPNCTLKISEDKLMAALYAAEDISRNDYLTLDFREISEAYAEHETILNDFIEPPTE